MSMLSREIVEQMGFASVGKNVSISDKAVFYNISQISLGDHVRIDDFCLLSAGCGGIEIRNYVHIAVGCSLLGQGKITFSDFSGLSSRVSIYSSSDDYSGEVMTNPTIPKEYVGVIQSDVFLGKHVIVGCGSVILPGVTLEEGAAVGALSLIRKDCEKFSIYAGNPAKKIASRSKNLLRLEKELCS